MSLKARMLEGEDGIKEMSTITEDKASCLVWDKMQCNYFRDEKGRYYTLVSRFIPVGKDEVMSNISEDHRWRESGGSNGHR